MVVDLMRYDYIQVNMNGAKSPWNVTIAVDDKVEHYPLETDGSTSGNLSFTYTRDGPGGCGKDQTMNVTVTIAPVPPNPFSNDAVETKAFGPYPCPSSETEQVSLRFGVTLGFVKTASWDFYFRITLTCLP